MQDIFGTEAVNSQRSQSHGIWLCLPWGKPSRTEPGRKVFLGTPVIWGTLAVFNFSPRLSLLLNTQQRERAYRCWLKEYKRQVCFRAGVDSLVPEHT